jgi:nitronate monooxygenase
MENLLRDGGLKPMFIKGHRILPIVQGGMGVGVSAHKLAGAVANLGGMGTISTIDLRRLHPDLMEKTNYLPASDETKQAINEANLEALSREIRAARKIADGHGMLAVNVMRAVSEYQPYVKRALEEGIDAVVVGAGLPLDLPDLAKDYPDVALMPILSDARGIQLVVKKWEKKGRLPDAIVIEHPGLAGGHLGAAKVEDLHDERFNFDRAIPESLEFFKSAGFDIPIIAAGGISCRDDIQRIQSYGAAGAQIGTAFAVTEESDAHPIFKKTLADARLEDIIEFVSVAGLPARAVKTPWLEKYLRIEPKLKAVAHKKKNCTMSFDCLLQCGLRDGNDKVGQFCIDKQLGLALTGDQQKGLFFRGAGILPFGQEIRPVKDLIAFLLSGHLSQATPA